ncbi:MAG TPA: twin transmembrane helix small protein [Gammaproteobacteria bacterium]
MKLLVALVFIGILFSLGSALLHLLKPDRAEQKSMAKALTWRIGLSIVLFVFLLLAYQFGWIEPHNIQQ